MLDKLIAFSFAVGVIAIPFDAIPGVTAFGELSNESSFYSFALAMGLWGLYTASAIMAGGGDAAPGRSEVWRAGAILVGAIIVSTVWNAADIGSATFHSRSGSVKLITSAMVIIYGLVLALLTCVAVPRRWYACLILPISISAIVCLGFSSLEAIDRAGVGVPFFDVLDAAIHTGKDSDIEAWSGAVNLKVVEGWDPRLRSVSFEPPAFGNFTGLAWPWLLSAVLMTRSSRKIFHAVLLALFTILIFASQARTGWLLLATNIATFGLLRFVFLPPNGQVHRTGTLILGSILVLAVGSGVIFYALSYETLVSSVVSGTSVSDLSRLAYQVTALQIFTTSPVVGVGLGQFAFNAAPNMPAWGFLSPEVGPSLLYPEAPWPNTYSLYTRLAAELGLVGLAGWVVLWATLIISVYRAALVYASLGRPVPAIAYAIIMTSICILATGLTTDTFRTPMFWITLGAGACFSARARQWTKARSRAKPV
ncbi:O-antigen ligase family protein [Microvirga sp. 0TCS3.31]